MTCWNELVTHMSIGEKIKVHVPSKFAHGSEGFNKLVPPHSDIEFEIELVSFKDPISEE